MRDATQIYVIYIGHKILQLSATLLQQCMHLFLHNLTQINRFPFWKYIALTRVWHTHPPVQVALAQYLRHYISIFQHYRNFRIGMSLTRCQFPLAFPSLPSILQLSLSISRETGLSIRPSLPLRSSGWLVDNSPIFWTNWRPMVYRAPAVKNENTSTSGGRTW